MRLVTHCSLAVPACELAESEISIQAGLSLVCFKVTELEEKWNQQGLTLKVGQCLVSIFTCILFISFLYNLIR